MGNKISLEDELVNLKITSKQMQRAAKKCDKNEKDAVNKLKKAIAQGNSEGARIYAQDAIREKNQVSRIVCVSPFPYFKITSFHDI